MLDAVERRISQLVAGTNAEAVAALYAKLPAGKRLRAKLIGIIAGGGQSAVTLAAIVELVHAASLLHDDVIDDAMMRRAKPSLNAIYGNKSAIMLGDILYAKAFATLSQLDKRIAETIAEAVVQLSIGELQDVTLSKRFMPDRERYLQMIWQKTASLIEASAASAAILAGKDANIYGRYGRKLGIAFQMIDDLLDITQNEEVLGKPAMHDFAEGKTTLPYIYLYEALDAEGQARLRAAHGKHLQAQERAWILDRMHKEGVVARCVEEAKRLAKEATATMEAENEPRLARIASEMVERSF